MTSHRNIALLEEYENKIHFLKKKGKEKEKKRKLLLPAMFHVIFQKFSSYVLLWNKPMRQKPANNAFFHHITLDGHATSTCYENSLWWAYTHQNPSFPMMLMKIPNCQLNFTFDSFFLLPLHIMDISNLAFSPLLFHVCSVL